MNLADVLVSAAAVFHVSDAQAGCAATVALAEHVSEHKALGIL